MYLFTLITDPFISLLSNFSAALDFSFPFIYTHKKISSSIHVTVSVFFRYFILFKRSKILCNTACEKVISKPPWLKEFYHSYLNINPYLSTWLCDSNFLAVLQSFIQQYFFYILPKTSAMGVFVYCWLQKQFSEPSLSASNLNCNCQICKTVLIILSRGAIIWQAITSKPSTTCSYLLCWVTFLYPDGYFLNIMIFYIFCFETHHRIPLFQIVTRKWNYILHQKEKTWNACYTAATHYFL